MQDATLQILSSTYITYSPIWGENWNLNLRKIFNKESMFYYSTYVDIFGI